MKNLVLACWLFAVPALAQAPDAGFKARHVTRGGDKKGLDELYKAVEEAARKGDVEAMAARVDFPVMMITDNGAGVPSSVMWDRAAWVETMKKGLAGMPSPKDTKWAKKTKPTFISDSIAMVEEANDITLGKVNDKWTSASIVVLKDGKWMLKAILEGGWADLIPATRRK